MGTRKGKERGAFEGGQELSLEEKLEGNAETKCPDQGVQKKGDQYAPDQEG